MIKIHIEGDANDPKMVSILAILAGTGTPLAFAPVPQSEDDDDASVPATPANPNEVDVNNMPWDERIHSKARSKNADGSWRKRKGVADDTVTAVEAELRSRTASAPVTGMNNPAPAGAPAAPNPTPPVPSPAPVAPAPVSVPIPAEPVAAAPAPAGVAGAPADFAGFMEIISKSMGANLIDSGGQFIAWLCAQPDVGVSQITEIAANPAKITAAYNHLVAQNRIAS